MSTLNNIGLIGYGVVGQGFYDYLKNQGEEKKVPTIIVKNIHKKRNIEHKFFQLDAEHVLKDKHIKTIVELIDAELEALEIVEAGLEKGAAVISANKKMIANNLNRLIELDKKSDAGFLYEGAVCGSIPILRILNDFYSHEKVLELSGILNGSSNYILSKIYNENLSYDEALKQAQELGFAETDPTSDVAGYDALYKLVILTAHAFGKVVRPEEVLNIGIEYVDKEDIEFAKKYNLKIKLVARAKQVNGELVLYVAPTFINEDNELYGIENEYNGVLINSEHVGKQFYSGKGAGSKPTGSVVISDYQASKINYRYHYQKLNTGDSILSNDKEVNVLLRFKQAIDVDYLKLEAKEFIPVNGSGTQFLAKIELRELLLNKFDLIRNKVSVIVVEDAEVIQNILNDQYADAIVNS